MTNIFKEFASANGYETGSNSNHDLHSIFGGMQSLNYSTGRPTEIRYLQRRLRSVDE